MLRHVWAFFLSGGSVCGLLGLIAARPEGEGSVCLDFMQIMEPDLRFLLMCNLLVVWNYENEI